MIVVVCFLIFLLTVGSGGLTTSSSGIFDDIFSEDDVTFFSSFFREVRGVATAFLLIVFDEFFVTSELLIDVRLASMPLPPKGYLYV